MEAQRTGLVDAAQIRGGTIARRESDERYVIERAIDLVRGSKDEGDAATGLTYKLQKVQGPAGIDSEIVAWISEAGSNGDLGGEVKHGPNVGKRLPQLCDRSDVALHNLHARTVHGAKPMQVFLGARPAQVVVNPHRPAA